MSEDNVDPGRQLTNLLLLGHWFQEREAIDRACQAVAKDPDEWTDTGIQTALWAVRVGEQMTEAIPGIIQKSGMRPATAVEKMVKAALLFGVEVGRQLERQNNG